jgi:ABC-type glycerol-3-phosphate transport system substrate-binding protein
MNKTRILLVLSGLLLITIVFLRAGLTRSLVEPLFSKDPPRPIQLRVWDWWSPSSNEEYGQYFNEIERIFEARNPEVDIVYQMVPFGNYVQKLSTAMVGHTPPDVFQSSVYWAEGFHQRGMLRPLNDLLAANHQAPPPQRVTQDMFLPSAWRHNQAQDGTIFGIPQIVDASCLLWNLDILEQAAAQDEEIRALFVQLPNGQIDYDRLRFNAVKDWQHFRRLTQKLTRRSADGTLEQAGFVIYAYGGGAGMFSPWLAANGGRYQDAAGRRALFGSAAGIEALRFMAKLYWEDGVCPPFRRQISDVELFQEGKVACMVAGTWSGKDIIRNTLGWDHFAKTAFPPGPRGTTQKTVTWGNMLVIPRRCTKVDVAWRYIQFVCSLEGNLIRSKTLGYNGPRLDFYETQQWQQAVDQRPYLSNVKQICLAGNKLRHTEIIAVNHQVNPVIETLLLNFPEIEAGQGPHPSVQAALQEAERNANGVFKRYNEQVSRWLKKRGDS